MRRRATILLDEEDIHYLFSLKPGERMVAVWPEPMVNGVMFGIEGDETSDIPEVPPGMEAPRIDRPYAIVRLRERLRQIVATMHTYETSGRDAYLRAVGELVEKEVFPHLAIAVLPPEVP